MNHMSMVIDFWLRRNRMSYEELRNILVERPPNNSMPWNLLIYYLLQTEFFRKYPLRNKGNSSQISWEDNLVGFTVRKEFEDLLRNVSYSNRGILNTEALIIYSLIRKYQPDIFFESGTYYGYSSYFICEALKRNNNNPTFKTFTLDKDGCLNFSRNYLKDYKFCEVIEGESQKHLVEYKDISHGKKIGFFIDGPKGASADFDELMHVLSAFEGFQFIACHDCEDHIPPYYDTHIKRGFINKTRLKFEHYYNKFFKEKGYKLYFINNEWCEKNQSLDADIFKSDKLVQPYFFKKGKQISYGLTMGVIIK